MNLNKIIESVGLSKDGEFGSETKPAETVTPGTSGSEKSETRAAEKQQPTAGSDAEATGPVETDAKPAGSQEPKEADTSAGSETGASGKPEEKQTHTHEEKEKFAWKKLNEKARGMREQISALEAQLAELRKKAPAKEADFPNKMDYIQAKVDEKLDARAIKANEAAVQNLKEQADSSEIEAETARAQYLIKQTYATKEEQDEYSRTVKLAAEHGMAQILDGTDGGRDVIEFCKNTDLAPRLIYHLAKSPDDFVNIVRDPDHASRMASLRYLERKLADAFAKQPPAEKQEQAKAPKKAVPVLGKIGVGESAGGRLSDAELIKKSRELRYGLSR